MMLPPIVPTCRICGEPKIDTISWNSGTASRTMASISVQRGAGTGDDRIAVVARFDRSARQFGDAIQIEKHVGIDDAFVELHADVGRPGDDLCASG